MHIQHQIGAYFNKMIVFGAQIKTLA